MRQCYVTVLINDLPKSVVRTESYSEAISITAWLSGGTATVERLPAVAGRKRRGPSRQHFRCRRSSVSEIALFDNRDIKWIEAQLVAIML